MKTLLIADDLTGALDSGVQFSKKKISTTVYLGIEESISPDSEVIIINSNSRHDSPDVAYNKVENILKKYADRFELIFLKTDSGLRGNISATLKAGIDVLQQPLTFVPAYPSVNRKTIGGVHYINGELLQNSIFKEDFRGLKSSHVADIINQDFQVSTQLISKDHVNSFLLHDQTTSSVNVFDCDSLAHIETIVKALQKSNRLTFIAGCAELAHVISEKVYANIANRELIGNVLNGPMLLINGSINQVSLTQINQAQKEGKAIVKLNADVLFNKDISIPFKRLKDELVEKMRQSKFVILTTVMDESDLLHLKQIAKNYEITDQELSANIQQKINMIVKSVYSEVFIEKLVIFGGETAMGVLKTLEIKDLIPIGEVNMGIPYAIAMHGENKIRIITKSGALGDEDIIHDIEQYLNQFSSFMEGTI